MAVKTITVTESAYNALKVMKSTNESFSKLILRISKRRPLSDFFGVISPESGKRMETSILKSRKARNLAHKARVKAIVGELRRE